MKPESQPLVNIDRFAKLSKLLRVTAWVKRACYNFRHHANRKAGGLCLQEIAEARSLWDRWTQQEAFPQSMGRSWNQWLKHSRLNQLKVYKDSSGLLRCRSRLDRSQLPSDAKEPVLLPKSHRYTNLVILHAHARACHVGVAQTLANLRQTYWIVHGRSQVKKALRECNVCRRVEGGSYAAPPPPALPDIRVKERSPFANTGLDYFGPPLIKRKDSDSHKERFGCAQKSVGMSVYVCVDTGSSS